jgi:hypothetical protein
MVWSCGAGADAAGALAELELYARTGYEESKFLGGDLSQTHLVKGLDFLLLDKLRREAAGQGAADEEAALDAALEGQRPGSGSAAPPPSARDSSR